MSETHAKSQLGGQLVFQLWTYLEDLRLNNPHPRAMKSLVSPDPGFFYFRTSELTSGGTRLTLVDLAGSEKVSKSDCAGETFEEAIGGSGEDGAWIPADTAYIGSRGNGE
jgi:hypothetical protein